MAKSKYYSLILEAKGAVSGWMCNQEVTYSWGSSISRKAALYAVLMTSPVVDDGWGISHNWSIPSTRDALKNFRKARKLLSKGRAFIEFYDWREDSDSLEVREAGLYNCYHVTLGDLCDMLGLEYCGNAIRGL